MYIETAIFKSLLTDQEYTRKVLPYLVEDFFSERKKNGKMKDFFGKKRRIIFLRKEWTYTSKSVKREASFYQTLWTIACDI